MLETGKYFGSIESAGTTVKGEKETPFLYITIVVSHKAENDEWIEIEQARRDVEFCINEKAWDFTVEKLEKIGFNGNFDCPLFAEKYYVDGVNLVCEHEEYNGKVYDKWYFEDAMNTRTYKALDTNELTKLAAKYKIATKKPTMAAAPGPKTKLPPSAGSSGTQPAPAGQKQTAEPFMAPADADIPF